MAGSIFYAVTWSPEIEEARAAPQEETCEEPPCFGGGGLPDAQSLPIALPLIGYGIAVLLGVPALLKALRLAISRDRSKAPASLLLFVGPLLVLMGIELVPHLISPCTAAQFELIEAPGICETTADGIDIQDRWHPMTHTLVGGVPMIALYRLALRRRHPAIVHRAGRAAEQRTSNAD